MTTNIGLALLSSREHGGRVFGSDLRIRVLATGLAAHPDVTVVRGPIAADPESPNTATNPRVIVEVLSDATEQFDCSIKLDHYRRIPSLRAILLVSHRTRAIEVWRRGIDAPWFLTVHGPGTEIELKSIGVRFAVDDVYRGVLDHSGSLASGTRP